MLHHSFILTVTAATILALTGYAYAQNYKKIEQLLPSTPTATATTPTQPTPPIGEGLYDAKGVIVGQIISPGVVQRKIGSQWVAFRASLAGLYVNNTAGIHTYFLYAGKTCKGTAYLPFCGQMPCGIASFGGIGAPTFGLVDGTINSVEIGADQGIGYALTGTLYYAGTPSKVTIASTYGVSQFSPLQGSCQIYPSTPTSTIVGPLITTKLGPFTPPFTVR